MAFPSAPRPQAPQLHVAHEVLTYAHSTASSFLTTFNQRQADRGRGAPADHDTDLLRAMLVFACAGLDSTVKHAIRDALPALIEHDHEVHERFRKFVKAQLPLDQQRTTDLLSTVLTARSTRTALIELLIETLTGRSLQSKAEILTAGSYFDLSRAQLIENTGLFDRIFRARNQIVHEMDIDFDQARRNRAPRPRHEMVEFTGAVLACAARFLAGVDTKLRLESTTE